MHIFYVSWKIRRSPYFFMIVPEASLFFSYNTFIFYLIDSFILWRMMLLPCSFLVAAIAMFEWWMRNQTYPTERYSSGNLFLFSQFRKMNNSFHSDFRIQTLSWCFFPFPSIPLHVTSTFTFDFYRFRVSVIGGVRDFDDFIPPLLWFLIQSLLQFGLFSSRIFHQSFWEKRCHFKPEISKWCHKVQSWVFLSLLSII